MKNLIQKFPKIGKLKPDMAGAIMLPFSQVPLSKASDTIAEVEKMLLKKTGEFETINYVYIVDVDQKLKGVISIKEIFRSPKETILSEIMKTKLVRVRPRTDQERVALLAISHNLKAIPVVDKTEKLLGVVSSDVILDALNKEATEDILRLAGVHRFNKMTVDVTKAPTKTLVLARIPWLLVGLAGGISAARIAGFFEATLETQIILAFFIPVIVYMSDAVATQTQTMFIRALVLNPTLIVRNYFSKEMKIGSSIAIICAVLLTLASFLFQVPSVIGLILGVAMFSSIFLSVVINIFIPWILQKFKKDPAIGAGPLATIITDVLSLIIYFSVASIMIKIFPL